MPIQSTLLLAGKIRLFSQKLAHFYLHIVSIRVYLWVFKYYLPTYRIPILINSYSKRTAYSQKQLLKSTFFSNNSRRRSCTLNCQTCLYNFEHTWNNNPLLTVLLSLGVTNSKDLLQSVSTWDENICYIKLNVFRWWV